MCTCTSCKFTDSFRNKSFADWPRGNPAGRKAASEYAAHVRYSKTGGVNSAIGPINTDPIAFYGVPAGSNRKQQLDVLRATFAQA